MAHVPAPVPILDPDPPTSGTSEDGPITPRSMRVFSCLPFIA